MKKSDIFADEIALIQDKYLKDKVTTFLDDEVPDYFWKVAASSSGKYHPNFASGEGGLVRHTQMVVAVLKEIKAIQEITDDIFDCLVVACLIHDTFKHGYKDVGFTVNEHPVIAAESWAMFVKDDMSFYKNEIIYTCVLRHMGQWGPYIAKMEKTLYNGRGTMDFYCSIVHLCDYIASRKFFDKFS